MEDRILRHFSLVTHLSFVMSFCEVFKFWAGCWWICGWWTKVCGDLSGVLSLEACLKRLKLKNNERTALSLPDCNKNRFSINHGWKKLMCKTHQNIIRSYRLQTADLILSQDCKTSLHIIVLQKRKKKKPQKLIIGNLLMCALWESHCLEFRSSWRLKSWNRKQQMKRFSGQLRVNIRESHLIDNLIMKAL